MEYSGGVSTNVQRSCSTLKHANSITERGLHLPLLNYVHESLATAAMLLNPLEIISHVYPHNKCWASSPQVLVGFLTPSTGFLSLLPY